MYLALPIHTCACLQTLQVLLAPTPQAAGHETMMAGSQPPKAGCMPSPLNKSSGTNCAPLVNELQQPTTHF